MASLQIYSPIPSPKDSSQRKYLHIPTDQPILFLAGPIRNASHWHNEAIRIAHAKNWHGCIASPAREIADDLADLVALDKPKYETFPRQRAWEQHYMYAAAEKGCIVFWLCAEALPKQFPDKVYAHITMLELGKWIERKKLFPATRLVIGTDGNFPEWSTIEFEIKTELPNLPIFTSLEQTVEAARTLTTI